MLYNRTVIHVEKIIKKVEKDGELTPSGGKSRERGVVHPGGKLKNKNSSASCDNPHTLRHHQYLLMGNHTYIPAKFIHALVP